MFLKLVYLTLITLYRNQLVGIYYIKPFKLFHQDQEIFIHEEKKMFFNMDSTDEKWIVMSA